MRILALMTDGFGGRGGIARFNHNFFEALSSLPGVEKITILTRTQWDDVAKIPEKVRQERPDVSKTRYVLHSLKKMVWDGPFDMIFCGHINLIIPAVFIGKLFNRPVWLQLHGIEAWTKPPWLKRWACEHVWGVTAVSRYTRRKFLSWSGMDPGFVKVLPCCHVNNHEYRASAAAALRSKLDLISGKIILSVGRMDPHEKYKGFDLVIKALPGLLKIIPNAVYLIVGEGRDRLRLESLARQEGVFDKVLFAGFVKEEALTAYYQAADVFVMPSRGEGFGIVYLEAMAAGLSVIALN